MFNFQLVMISALTPVAVFIWYLYRKDKANPEPVYNHIRHASRSGIHLYRWREMDIGAETYYRRHLAA